jgi:N-ethylmaleimide reductase
MVAFGRHFAANRTWSSASARNAPLNPYDRSTFYGDDHRGYIDYPFLTAETSAQPASMMSSTPVYSL